MTGPNSPHYFFPKKAPKIPTIFTIFDQFRVPPQKVNFLGLTCCLGVLSRAIGKKGFWGASYIIFHISKSYFKKKKKKKKHEFTGKNPFRAFGPARWRGISPHMWICPENFQESAGHIHIKMGPDISTGGIGT